MPIEAVEKLTDAYVQTIQQGLLGLAIAQVVAFLLLLLVVWRIAGNAGNESKRNDGLIGTLVGNNTQALTKITDKLDTDTQYRIQDRKLLTTISDAAGKQVELLTGVREDLRGVAVLGGKIDTLQDMVRGLKNSVELLISASADGSDDHDTIQSTLERVSLQLGVLIEEGRESHVELLNAIRLITPPPPTEPASTKPAAPPNVLDMDGAKADATVDLPKLRGDELPRTGTEG